MKAEMEVYKGKITFISHEKHFATIDYIYHGKQKSVNCKTTAEKSGKKPHQFRLGDVLSFQLKLADRGDKLTAYNIKFLHNEAMALLIQKAAVENRFSGYLKKIDDQYFVKELDSYILFPLQLSPWEKPPATSAENEAISFSLINLDKPNAIAATLFSHNFLPEYKMAVQHYKNKIDVAATVFKTSPHGIYLHLFDGKMQAKLPAPSAGQPLPGVGDVIPVAITHLTAFRIVVRAIES